MYIALLFIIATAPATAPVAPPASQPVLLADMQARIAAAEANTAAATAEASAAKSEAAAARASAAEAAASASKAARSAVPWDRYLALALASVALVIAYRNWRMSRYPGVRALDIRLQDKIGPDAAGKRSIYFRMFCYGIDLYDVRVCLEVGRTDTPVPVQMNFDPVYPVTYPLKAGQYIPYEMPQKALQQLAQAGLPPIEQQPIGRVSIAVYTCQDVLVKRFAAKSFASVLRQIHIPIKVMLVNNPDGSTSVSTAGGMSATIRISPVQGSLPDDDDPPSTRDDAKPEA